jgi:hypothetical protein
MVLISAALAGAELGAVLGSADGLADADAWLFAVVSEADGLAEGAGVFPPQAVSANNITTAKTAASIFEYFFNYYSSITCIFTKGLYSLQGGISISNLVNFV